MFFQQSSRLIPCAADKILLLGRRRRGATGGPEPESTEEAPVEKTFLPPYVWYGLGGAAVILLGVILISGRRKKNTAEDDNDPLELFLQERERREHEKHQDD